MPDAAAFAWPPQTDPLLSSESFSPAPPLSSRGPLHSGSTWAGVQRSGRNSYEVTVKLDTCVPPPRRLLSFVGRPRELTFLPFARSVDMATGSLTGTLEIKGLTPELESLVTFFEGEIVGESGGPGFRTAKYGATEVDDLKHWRRFPAFTRNRLENQLVKPGLHLRNAAQRPFVFMRWKEQFVTSHRVEAIHGASYAGFYYCCTSDALSISCALCSRGGRSLARSCRPRLRPVRLRARRRPAPRHLARSPSTFSSSTSYSAYIVVHPRQRGDRAPVADSPRRSSRTLGLAAAADRQPPCDDAGAGSSTPRTASSQQQRQLLVCGGAARRQPGGRRLLNFAVRLFLFLASLLVNLPLKHARQRTAAVDRPPDAEARARLGVPLARLGRGSSTPRRQPAADVAGARQLAAAALARAAAPCAALRRRRRRRRRRRVARADAGLLFDLAAGSSLGRHDAPHELGRRERPRQDEARAVGRRREEEERRRAGCRGRRGGRPWTAQLDRRDHHWGAFRFLSLAVLSPDLARAHD